MAPFVVDLNLSELDRIVAQDLGRAHHQPGMVLPVSIRRRPVLLLYGDCGGETLELEGFSELLSSLPLVSAAFERLILKKKQASINPPPSASVRPQEPEKPAKTESSSPESTALSPSSNLTPPEKTSVESGSGQKLYTNGPEATPLLGPVPGFLAHSSVIVDMGERIEGLVDELCTTSPGAEDRVVRMLLDVGEAALPILAQRFPGPLWFDRNRPHRRLPRGSDISAVARALVAFRDRAIPYVISRLDAGHVDVRFYATLLSSEFIDRRLVEPVGQRIFDEDEGVRALAIDVLRLFRHFSKELSSVLRGVRTEAENMRNAIEKRGVAVKALGELRDVSSLLFLIDLLKTSSAEIQECARRSLVVLSRQDFGNSAEQWARWAEENSGRHRIEWLIDALLHSEEGMRALAVEELKHLTQEYYGYHPSLSKKEREIAQRKYVSWWNGEGRKRFVPN